MKPVYQTEFGGEKGNCFAACLASVFEIPIEAAPDLWAGEQRGLYWVQIVNDWLKPRGLWYCDVKFLGISPKGYHLIGGQSARGLSHAVVGFNGEMVHDPHPDGAGLVEVQDFGLFIARDPSLLLASGTPMLAGRTLP